MKPTIFLVFCTAFFYNQLLAQPIGTLIEAAKNEFSKDFYQQDFSKLAEQLDAANRSTPNNPEINYFLGYALDRINSGDIRTLFLKTRTGCELASLCLEKVNRLTPLYTGTKLSLDPYSKLTTIWGSLALAYAYREAPDSARWAFQQGKARGGFLDPQLELAANMLNSCKKNALLFSSGEAFTYPLLYLQTVEQVRKDVQIIDIGMLNTLWYPELLDATATNPIVADSLNISMLTDLVEWQPGTMTADVKSAECGEINTFLWKMDPKLDSAMMVRSEYALLQIIILNQFINDIYFTAGFPSDDLLQLDDRLENGVLLSRLNPCKSVSIRSATDYVTPYRFEKIKTGATAIRNSPDLAFLLQFYVLGYANAAQECISKGDLPRSKALLNDLEQRFPLASLSNLNSGMTDYLQKLKDLIKKVE
jgi:hypothetical protein